MCPKYQRTSFLSKIFHLPRREKKCRGVLGRVDRDHARGVLGERTELTQVSGTGIEVVPNLPKRWIPVLKSHRTSRSVGHRNRILRECSVGYRGRSEPFQDLGRVFTEQIPPVYFGWACYPTEHTVNCVVQSCIFNLTPLRLSEAYIKPYRTALSFGEKLLGTRRKICPQNRRAKRLPYRARGGILIRTHDGPKKLYIPLFLDTILGRDYYIPP